MWACIGRVCDFTRGEQIFSSQAFSGLSLVFPFFFGSCLRKALTDLYVCFLLLLCLPHQFSGTDFSLDF